MARVKHNEENVYPFRFGSTQHAEHARARLAERDEERRFMFVRRRRWLLWTPLAALGAALLIWQVTLWEPSLALLLVGIAMCLPWVCDV